MSGRGCRVKGGVCSMPPWNARKWLIHAAIPARMANTEIGESIMSLRSVKTLVAYEIADDPVARFYRAIPSRVRILRNGDLHSQAFACGRFHDITRACREDREKHGGAGFCE